MKLFTFLLFGLIVSLSSFSQQTGGPYTSDENTVLLMHFDGDATNSSGVGNNGVAHGSGVSYETGVHGQALRLDNTSWDKQSWIEVPFYDELNVGDGFAVECWFKINSWGENTDGARQLFRKDGESWVADYDAYIGENLDEGRQGQVNLNCLADEEQDWGADAPIADFLELNKWYHIAMYYSSTLQHICCVIRDENNKEIFASRGYSKTGPENSTGLFRIGFGEASNSYFDGWIDELRISNVYRKYRDDVLKDVDISAFKDSVFIPIDKWLSYGWPFGEFYPIDPETGDVARKNSCGPMMLSRAIHFWEHPRFPSGVIEHDFQGLPWYANYDETEYLWDQIYDFYNSDATEEYYAPAATFTAQVGVASRKTYDNMYCMPKFLKENFHYSKKTRVVFEEEYTKEEWENIIKNELNNGRICMVGGWGHYYIINGYNSKNEFFTDYSMNDYYWNDIKEFDYGDMQDMIIYFEPDWQGKTLELDYPIGDEYIQKLTDIDIEWSSTNVNQLLIEYSSDAGKTWIEIANDIEASQNNYTWTLPETTTSDFKIRIADKADLNVYRRSATFNVYDEKLFSFEYPIENTYFQAGSKQPIYWSSNGIPNFKLEYSTDGENWILIEQSIESALGKYEMEIPNIESEAVLLKATDSNDESIFYVSETFMIQSPELERGPFQTDENTVLLMHFEENLSNAASTVAQASENLALGAYEENYTHHLGKAFKLHSSETTFHSLVVPNCDEINLDGSWSIEMWFKTNSLNAELLSKHSDVGENYNIHVEAPDGHMEARFYDTNGTRFQIGTPAGMIQVDNWYHVNFINNTNVNELQLIIRDNDFAVIYSNTLSYPVGTTPSIGDGDLNIGYGINGLIDELRIKKFVQTDVPELPELLAQSEYVEFYAPADQLTKWNEINEDVDNWFKGLRSYWERPGLDLLFNEGEKIKIFLVEKEYLSEYVGFNFPDWRYGGYKIPNEIYVALPPGGDNDIYEGSFPVLVKNIFAQLVLKKKQIRDSGGYSPFYFREGFGLLYSGYRANQDSIMQALSDLGRAPVVSDFLDASDFSTSYKKDLMVSYLEAQALSVVGIQGINPNGYETIWERHLKHYYQDAESVRITLRKETDNFNIYSAPQDIQYLTAIADKLEEKLAHYETVFEFPIHHKINLVIYPDSETAADCIVFMDSYSWGSGWSGDKLDILSPIHIEGGLNGILDFLIPHEFFHVFHFNLVTHLFSIPAFYSEGLANHMAQGFVDPDTEDDLWKIQVAFNHYMNNYSRQPNLADFLVSEVDATYNYHNDPYFFGEAFYSYMMSGVASYVDLKAFFAANLDYSVFSISYEDIDAGYINYLKSIAGIQTDLPGVPSNPVPQNQATAISTNPNLSWSNGSNTDQLDLYFSTTNPPTQKVLSNVTSTAYQPTGLSYETIYYWKVVNKNTVGDTQGSVWSFTTDVGTGIFNNYEESELLMYPNPSNKNLYISSPERVVLSIFTLSGRKILEKTNFLSGEINLSEFPKGVYIVRFLSKKGIVTKKLLVE